MKLVIHTSKTISSCSSCDYFRDWDEAIITSSYYKKEEPDRCLKVHHPTLGGPREVKDKSKIPDWCPLLKGSNKYE